MSGFAVLVQQALLGRDQRALAVDEERAALEHHRGDVAANTQVAGDDLGHARVKLGGWSGSPQPLKPKSTRATWPWASRTKIGPLSRIHESSSSISSNSIRADSIRATSPSCSVRTSISTGSNSATGVCDGGLLHLCLQIGLRAGASLGRDVRLGPAGPGHQRKLVGLPFRGHGKSVVAWCAGHPGLLILGPAAPSWSAGLCNYPPMADSIEVNRAYWDERVAAHAASPEYAVARFAEDPSYLSEVVRFDRPRLGDLNGLELVHLQCHIGTDTVSLGRLGASVTGVDLSTPALAEARLLARAAGIDARFVESEVYAAAEVLRDGQRSTWSTPASGRCAGCPISAGGREVVAGLLRPGGRLFIREAHPVLWSLELDRPDGLLVLEYPYFETDSPVILDDPGEFGDTYVQTDQVFVTKTTHEWNHGLGEIVSALLAAGMQPTLLQEHDSVPWEAVKGMVDTGGGEWRLTDRPERLPHSYTLQAQRG